MIYLLLSTLFDNLSDLEIDNNNNNYNANTKFILIEIYQKILIHLFDYYPFVIKFVLDYKINIEEDIFKN